MQPFRGSGFFISADGYAVTNNHVVAHAIFDGCDAKTEPMATGMATEGPSPRASYRFFGRSLCCHRWPLIEPR
jgi:hypothetical protein